MCYRILVNLHLWVLKKISIVRRYTFGAEEMKNRYRSKYAFNIKSQKILNENSKVKCKVWRV